MWRKKASAHNAQWKRGPILFTSQVLNTSISRATPLILFSHFSFISSVPTLPIHSLVLSLCVEKKKGEIEMREEVSDKLSVL